MANKEMKPKVYALLLVRELYRSDDHAWHVRSLADQDDLNYAVERGWVELSPKQDAMRLTDAGRYAIKYLWGA